MSTAVVQLHDAADAHASKAALQTRHATGATQAQGDLDTTDLIILFKSDVAEPQAAAESAVGRQVGRLV